MRPVYWLVVEPYRTPLKNHGVRQFGSLFPIYGEKKCSKPPTSISWIQPFWLRSLLNTIPVKNSLKPPTSYVTADEISKMSLFVAPWVTTFHLSPGPPVTTWTKQRAVTPWVPLQFTMSTDFLRRVVGECEIHSHQPIIQCGAPQL